ncbi:MAG: hypothetical protein ABSF69_14565 [Polyangiaceae bacterium]|jgi:hypothetical protein
MGIDGSFSKCRVRWVAAVAASLVAGCSSNGASSPSSAPATEASGASSSALDSGTTADASAIGADIDSSIVTSDGATRASVDAGPGPDATGDASTGDFSEASTPLEAGLSDVSAESESSEAGPTPAPTPAAMLSETGLFKSVASDGTLNLQDGVQEYQPMYSLWADGAEKTRWILLPPGTQIDTTDLDHWSFPTGTKFWKEFALDGQRLETRLLWIYGPGADDFLLVTYWWNPEAGIADDAELANPFGVQNVNGTTHNVPAQEDCHTCHDALEEHVLGFGAIELNHTLPGVNIHTLIDAGSLTNNPEIADLTIPGDSTAQAALGYLHANCGNCHNITPGATGIPTPAMILRLFVGATTVEDTQAYQTSVNVATTDFTGIPYRIAGQDPMDSCITHTMLTRGGREQMPPLATDFVDDAGVAAVNAWIRTLPPPL